VPTFDTRRPCRRAAAPLHERHADGTARQLTKRIKPASILFQRTLTSSRFTLTTVSVFAVVIWLAHMLATCGTADHLPYASLDQLRACLQSGTLLSMPAALLACGICVYLAAELNNAFSLLRVTSRTISSTLFLLVTGMASLHTIDAAHVVLACSVIGFFPLLSCYQRIDRRLMVFLAALSMGLTSCVQPAFAWMLPFLWIYLILLQAFSFRAILASLFGLITPWWLYAAGAFYTDQLPAFLAHAGEALQWTHPDYTTVTLQQAIPLATTLLVQLIGSVDYLLHKHLDRTRTRAFYNVILLHAALLWCWMIIRPQDIDHTLPAAMLCAAIAGGHFLALSHGRVQNIISIALALLLAASGIATLFL